jgi:hypothetical protein
MHIASWLACYPCSIRPLSSYTSLFILCCLIFLEESVDWNGARWSGVEWYAYAKGCGTRGGDDSQRMRVLVKVEQAFVDTFSLHGASLVKADVRVPVWLRL